MSKPTLREQLDQATERVAELESNNEEMSAQNAKLIGELGEAMDIGAAMQSDNVALNDENKKLQAAVVELTEKVAAAVTRAEAAEAKIALQAFDDISTGHDSAVDDDTGADGGDIFSQWKAKRGTPDEVAFFRNNKAAILQAWRQQKGK